MLFLPEDREVKVRPSFLPEGREVKVRPSFLPEDSEVKVGGSCFFYQRTVKSR